MQYQLHGISIRKTPPLLEPISSDFQCQKGISTEKNPNIGPLTIWLPKIKIKSLKSGGLGYVTFERGIVGLRKKSRAYCQKKEEENSRG
jgi:hypothetical protein